MDVSGPSDDELIFKLIRACDSPQWSSIGQVREVLLARFSALHARIAELEAGQRELLAMLERLQWIGISGQGGRGCPICRHSFLRDSEHAADCELAALLRKARGENDASHGGAIDVDAD